MKSGSARGMREETRKRDVGRRGPRGLAARSRVLARLASLAQTGELARTLRIPLTAAYKHPSPAPHQVIGLSGSTCTVS